MEVRRGDVVVVDLDPTQGSEQRGAARPCLVIQNDVGNQYSPTTIIAPFTTAYDPEETYPFEVEVTAANSPLDQDSAVNLAQIRTIDVEHRVASVHGSIPDDAMRRVDQALKYSLGL